MADVYLYLKSLHIVFVVTWFSALFYVVRLFVYQTEASLHQEPSTRHVLCEQMKRMAYRLWYVIGWPSAILAMLFGVLLLKPWLEQVWMWCKLGLVSLLLGYHFYCHWLFLGLQRNKYRLSSIQLRLLNEVPTLLLFPIVFLAVFKRLSGVGLGLLSLIVLAAVLYFAIHMYKHYRDMQSEKTQKK